MQFQQPVQHSKHGLNQVFCKQYKNIKKHYSRGGKEALEIKFQETAELKQTQIKTMASM